MDLPAHFVWNRRQVRCNRLNHALLKNGASEKSDFKQLTFKNKTLLLSIYIFGTKKIFPLYVEMVHKLLLGEVVGNTSPLVQETGGLNSPSSNSSHNWSYACAGPKPR